MRWWRLWEKSSAGWWFDWENESSLLLLLLVPELAHCWMTLREGGRPESRGFAALNSVQTGEEVLM